MNLINGIETDFRFAGIDKFDVNNGNGIGATLFVQGCSHHCKGCHNKSTWDESKGIPFTQNSYNELFEVLSKKQVSRLTLSGGDPLDNIGLSYFISKNFKKKFPEKKLWIYTGYKYEDIIKRDDCKKIIQLCDILVDGEFKIEEKNLRLQFRGSENQRIIDVQKSIVANEIVFWKREENYNGKSSSKI